MNLSTGEWFRKWWRPFRRSLIFLAFFIISIIFYYYNEGWSIEKTFGFLIVTITTVGYGYTYPTNDRSRLFTIFVMFFGVNYVFATVVNILLEKMNKMHLKVKKEFSVYTDNLNDIHLSHRRTLILFMIAIIVTILVGALILQRLEDWSFITAMYYCVETITTVGYGDLTLRGKHTQLFVCGYIVFSVVLLGFVVSSIQQLRAEQKQLHKIEQVLIKRTNLDFLFQINAGKGITEAQFVLAVLQHLGTVDAEKDVLPWVKKFKEYDLDNKGSLDLDSLEILASRESETARSQLAHLDDSSTTRRISLTDINDLWHRTYVPPKQSSFSGGGGQQPHLERDSSIRGTNVGFSPHDYAGGSISSSGGSGATSNPLRRSLGGGQQQQQTEKDLHDVL